MSLDMYLHARRHISKYDDTESEKATQIQEMFPELKDVGQPSEVIVEVGYWRKANAIHRWFVENIQKGTDDGKPYYVDRLQLHSLHDLCVRVLKFKHLADELLPTSTGFFFGSDEHDEVYYGQLEYTIQILDRSLKLPHVWSFEYSSSCSWVKWYSPAEQQRLVLDAAAQAVTKRSAAS